MLLQGLVRTIYPPQCAMCDQSTEHDFALCGACWADLNVVSGAICDSCGTQMTAEPSDEPLICQGCTIIARPWSRGRMATMYQGTGRRMILSLKHGDRIEIARLAAPLLAAAARDLILRDTLIVPVPLHWTRLLHRKFNQSALLAAALAHETGSTFLPDALQRPIKTKPLEGHSREERFSALQGAIRPKPRQCEFLRGRHVVIVDDVMTSGATFAAATLACVTAQARTVDVVALARVGKDP